MRFSEYPFDLITYRPEGAVYFVTDTLTAVKRFVFLTLVTDTLTALQTSDSKTFYTIRHEEPRLIDTRHGHTYRCKGIRFANIKCLSSLSVLHECLI